MATPIELPDHLTEHFQEVLTVCVIFIDRLSAITTRRHVLKRTTEFKANGSGHASDARPTDTTMLDLTPASCLGDVRGACYRAALTARRAQLGRT
jgi:hypothetical protein